MKSILVAVDYADILEITLPYNRHHFDDVMVVTTPTDLEVIQIARDNNCSVFPTTSFYDDGATFNKWKALEQGLDAFGREGWLCLMDADVLWPKQIPTYEKQVGAIYTPLRRMMTEISLPIPPEDMWRDYPHHRQQIEWAGYTQIFHATDPALPKAPWHQINWKHAGGADSFFQQCWPRPKKKRPSFEVLHLGPSGCNWCGRATDYVKGGRPEDYAKKMQAVRSFIRSRKRGRPNPFAGEQI